MTTGSSHRYWRQASTPWVAGAGASRCAPYFGLPRSSLAIFALCIYILHGLIVYGEEEPARR